MALPFNFTKFIEESNYYIKLINKLNENKLENNDSEKHHVIDILKKFKSELIKVFNDGIFDKTNSNNKYENENIEIPSKIISFGPNRSGANILVNLTEKYVKSIWHNLERNSNNLSLNLKASAFHKLEKSIVFGFNLATIKGPICAEPIQGVAFIIEDFQVNENLNDLIGVDFENLNLNENNKVDHINNSNLDSSNEDGNIAKHQNTYLKCINFLKEACLKSFSIQNVTYNNKFNVFNIELIF
jgi:ribosome assembly protein 1